MYNISSSSVALNFLPLLFKGINKSLSLYNWLPTILQYKHRIFPFWTLLISQYCCNYPGCQDCHWKIFSEQVNLLLLLKSKRYTLEALLLHIGKFNTIVDIQMFFHGMMLSHGQFNSRVQLNLIRCINHYDSAAVVLRLQTVSKHLVWEWILTAHQILPPYKRDVQGTYEGWFKMLHGLFSHIQFSLNWGIGF